MNNSKIKINTIAMAALIAALYVVFTYLSFLFGLSGTNMIQLRISEALCILAAYTPAAIPGLTIGCVLANLLTGSLLWDVVFGSFATFIGAAFTYFFRKRKYAASLPPIIANTLIVPFILMYVYGMPDGWTILALCVFTGEIISCGVLGTMLVWMFEKTKSGQNIKNILINRPF
ncbi:MAG: QueT transporter family protein [Eubacteriales bacterium]|nr:QueT transporter family protein [Eubacteriales bacterium]